MSEYYRQKRLPTFKLTHHAVLSNKRSFSRLSMCLDTLNDICRTNKHNRPKHRETNLQTNVKLTERNGPDISTNTEIRGRSIGTPRQLLDSTLPGFVCKRNHRFSRRKHSLSTTHWWCVPHCQTSKLIGGCEIGHVTAFNIEVCFLLVHLKCKLKWNKRIFVSLQLIALWILIRKVR